MISTVDRMTKYLKITEFPDPNQMGRHQTKSEVEFAKPKQEASFVNYYIILMVITLKTS